jgi:putative RecB family exonuclease
MTRRSPPTRRPGKLRLSPTRLRLYLFCPKAYHYCYVKGLRWGEMSPASSFGGSLHRALQAFHEAGALAPPSVEDLLQNFRSSWTTAGYRDSAEEAEHRDAGENILRQYFEAAQVPGREAVLVERQVKWEYPEFSILRERDQLELPGYVLIGKLDRLDRLPTGELEVVDYKSGRREVTEDDVRASLAMAVYQLIVARMYPNTPVLATVICLPTGAKATVRRAPEELDQLEQEIRMVAVRILTEATYNATPGAHCARCVFERICPAAWTKGQSQEA